MKGKQPDISVYISKYLVPVLERKRLVLLFLVLGILFSIPISFIIKPEYVDRATVSVEEPYYQIEKIKAHVAAPKAPKRCYISMEVERLKSSSFAAEVLKVLPGKTRSEMTVVYSVTSQIKMALKRVIGEERYQAIKKLLGGAEGGEGGTRKEIPIIFQIQKRIMIRGDAGTGLVRLTAKTMKKEVGSALLKSYLDVWMAINFEDGKKSARAQTRFAEQLRKEAYKNFLTVQKAVNDFRRRYEIPGSTEVTRDIELKVELDRLVSELEIARERLKSTDSLYVKAQMSEAGIMGNLKIIEYPGIPAKVTRAKEIRLMAAVILAGLAMGIGMALLLDFVEGPIRNEIDIQDVVDVPIQGQIDKVD